MDNTPSVNDWRLAPVMPDTAPPVIRDTYDNQLLPVVNVFQTMANATSVYPPFTEVMRALFVDSELDLRTARSAVLLVAKLLDCHYVWRQNVITAKSVGVTEEQVTAIQAGDLHSNHFTDTQRAALQFTQDSIIDAEVSDIVYANLRATQSSRQIAELLFLTGIYSMLCRFVHIGGVPLDEAVASSPYTA